MSKPLLSIVLGVGDKGLDFHDRAGWEAYVRDQKLDFDPGR